MDPQDNQQQGTQTGGAPVPPPAGGAPVPPPTGGTPVPPPAGGAPVPPPAGGAPVPPPAGGVPVPPPAGGAPVPPPTGGAPMPPPTGGAPMPPPAGGTTVPPPAGGAPMPPPTGGAPVPPPAGVNPMPAPVPEDTTPANFQLGTKFPPELKIKAPASELKFDEEYFIRLLAASISLSKDEKKKIVESIPKLKQAQIDELIRIFEEEKQKFAALSKKHVPQLEKLADQHYNDWMDLEAESQQEVKAEEDQSKADEIRKNLGL